MAKLSKKLRIQVQRFERFRYRVTSETTPGATYFVDLLCNNGNGRCDCVSFRVRCQTKLDDGAAPCRLTRCKHIAACRDEFCNEVLPLLAQKEAGGDV